MDTLKVRIPPSPPNMLVSVERVCGEFLFHVAMGV